MTPATQASGPARSPVRVGINGFGRMGRLATRVLAGRDDLELVAVNEPHADADTLALLLEFDSVQGRWDRPCHGVAGALEIDGRVVALRAETAPGSIDWSGLGAELVLECSGRFRKPEQLAPHFTNGARRVVVSAPVGGEVPDIVLGVNDAGIDFGAHRVVTAASCTTNCLAPVVRVLHDAVGIERGLVTTIHDPTNTQRVHDAPHKDPRRARAAQLNLIPTSTNSAVAVTRIVPELTGRLDSIAVRAPVLNASLTDCVFQVVRDTTVDEVNQALTEAAGRPPLQGILGVETRPLVSSDFAGDPRSGIVDAQSTRVTDRRLVKVLAWYDNEWGYANRLVELAGRVAAAL